MTKLTYKQTGVDVVKGDQVSQNAFEQIQQTFNSNTQVFKNLVSIKANFKRLKEPYLAFACDGVGTKLLYAFQSDQLSNVGQDAVAMCVNDLVRNNVTPLSFALYRAAGKFNQKQMADVVSGAVTACIESECVYVTGESAEMPGFYKPSEFDLAGFATGVFDKNELITGENIKKGDLVIGLGSSGLHSNGFSLVRKIFPPEKVRKDSKLHQQIVTPTKIYVKPILETNKKFKINGWAHITGGGLFGKLEKIVPDDLGINLQKKSWPVPPIFSEIQLQGKVSETEMFRTFNMGVGFAGILSKNLASGVVDFLKKKGEEVFIIGEVETLSKSEKVTLSK